MRGIRRIVHASDFSDASRAAFTRAVALARMYRADLLVLHVLTVVAPFVGEGYIPPRVWDQIEASQVAGARAKVNRLVARARRAGARVKGLLVLGSPYEEIARTARRTRADLLVMGTHGRSGIAKVLLGSVAERVLRTAPCPVLTVRGTIRRAR